MKFSFTKNPESEFSYKESKSNKKKKKKNLTGGRGGDGGVARVSDPSLKKSKSEKKIVLFLRG